MRFAVCAVLIFSALFSLHAEDYSADNQQIMLSTLYDENGEVVRNLYISYSEPSLNDADLPVVSWEEKEAYRVAAVSSSREVEEADYMNSYAPQINEEIPEEFVSGVFSSSYDVQEDEPKAENGGLLPFVTDTFLFVILSVFACPLLIVAVKILVIKRR